jgi:hypothetical protein
VALKKAHRRPYDIPIGSNADRGQAVTEYILLLAMIALLYIGVIKGLNRTNILGKMSESLLKKPFSAAYRYGQKTAKGKNDGGPYLHPRYIEGEKSFRIFLNPVPK